jgi:hypothetical protein
VPRDDADLPHRAEDAMRRIGALDWKLSDVVVAIVRELEDAPPDVVVEPRRGAVSARSGSGLQA